MFLPHEYEVNVSDGLKIYLSSLCSLQSAWSEETVFVHNSVFGNFNKDALRGIYGLQWLCKRRFQDSFRANLEENTLLLVIQSNHFQLALETTEPYLESDMQWLQRTLAN